MMVLLLTHISPFQEQSRVFSRSIIAGLCPDIQEQSRVFPSFKVRFVRRQANSLS
jgi:hypothetical protein